jgi:chromate transporter
MMILSALYKPMHTLPAVVMVFGGLQAVVVAIVAQATVYFGRAILRKAWDVIPALFAACMFGFGHHPILAIGLAALLGLVFCEREPFTPHRATFAATPRHFRLLVLLLSATAAFLLLLFFFDRRLADLAAVMFRIDLFAFGGGFGAAPLMFHEVVQVHSWMNGPTFLNGLALGQLTPGPVIITATFVGYLLDGPLGGAVATLAIFLPSFLIVIGLAPHMDRLNESPYFRKAACGILCSFVGLLLTVTVRFAAAVRWDWGHAMLAGAAFAALMSRVNIAWVVLAGILLSLVVL